MRRFDDAIALGSQMYENPEVTWKYDILEATVTWQRQNGDLAQALSVLEEARAILPLAYHPYLDHNQALIAAARGRLEEAEKYAGHAVTGFRRDRRLALVARLQFADGRAGEALKTLSDIKGVSESGRLFAFYTRAQVKQASQAPNTQDEIKKVLFLATRSAYAPFYWGPYLADVRIYCALAAARLGDSRLARQHITFALRLEPERADLAYVAACTYSLIGDTDQALAWLETAVERGHQELWWARVDPDLDPLRDLPRFNEIMTEWDRRLQALD
jgi:tetratricopeptide (TPR) repeat protein